MSWPAPSREAHDHFCRSEGWRVVRNAKGKKVGHHITYELTLPDGQVLRTRVSKPPDTTTYTKGLWNHILEDQLHVDEAAFWACVQDGVKPDRGVRAEPPAAVPADLAYLLRVNLHLSDAEIGSMTREDAIARMVEYWHRP